MSLKDKFEAVKAAIFNAMNFADPEAVLQKAEHEFKEGIVAEFDAIKERLAVLEGKGKPALEPVVEVSPVVAPVVESAPTAAVPLDVAPAPTVVADAAPASTEPSSPAA